MKKRTTSLVWAFLFAAGLGCSLSGKPVQVVATTTIIRDIVSRVGGEAIELRTLLPVDADPHAFQPTPKDLVDIENADVVFINGAGLESDIETLLANARGLVVALGDHLALRSFVESSAGGEGEPGQREEDHRHEGVDPHVWFDPTNVMIWVRVIEETLSDLDPAHASTFAENASVYRTELAELDLWIWEEIARIPRVQRVLVTDHAALGYFSARYGFEQVGTLFPGFSTLAEPSAKELARLEARVIELGIPAIFVGTTVNRALAEAVAVDTGTQIVSLYTGSLSEAGGPAGSYMDLMRYDVRAIVDALAG